jgi:hypothetical protein
MTLKFSEDVRSDLDTLLPHTSARTLQIIFDAKREIEYTDVIDNVVRIADEALATLQQLLFNETSDSADYNHDWYRVERAISEMRSLRTDQIKGLRV